MLISTLVRRPTSDDPVAHDAGSRRYCAARSPTRDTPRHSRLCRPVQRQSARRACRLDCSEITVETKGARAVSRSSFNQGPRPHVGRQPSQLRELGKRVRCGRPARLSVPMAIRFPRLKKASTGGAPAPVRSSSRARDKRRAFGCNPLELRSAGKLHAMHNEDGIVQKAHVLDIPDGVRLFGGNHDGSQVPSSSWSARHGALPSRRNSTSAFDSPGCTLDRAKGSCRSAARMPPQRAPATQSARRMRRQRCRTRRVRQALAAVRGRPFDDRGRAGVRKAYQLVEYDTPEADPGKRRRRDQRIRDIANQHGSESDRFGDGGVHGPNGSDTVGLTYQTTSPIDPPPESRPVFAIRPRIHDSFRGCV